MARKNVRLEPHSAAQAENCPSRELLVPAPGSNSKFNTVLSSIAAAIIAESNERPEVPVDSIARLATNPKKAEAEKTAAAVAEQRFRNTNRLAKREIAVMAIASIDGTLKNLEKISASIWALMAATIFGRQIGESTNMFRLASIPFWGRLCVGFVVCAIGVVFEVVQGLAVMRWAEHHQDEKTLFQIGVFAPYCLAVFAAGSALSIFLNAKWARRFIIGFGLVLLPLGVVGGFVYAVRMGGDMSSLGPTLFDTESAVASFFASFPTHAHMYIFGIWCSALAIYMGKALIASATDSLVNFRYQDTPQHVYCKETLATREHDRQCAVATKVGMQVVISDYDKDLALFVKECLGHLDYLRERITRLGIQTLEDGMERSHYHPRSIHAPSANGDHAGT